MNDLEKFIEGVSGICEANSFEHSCLWERWHTRGKWEHSYCGLGLTLGGIDNRPVCIAINTIKYNGKKILFWYCTSQVCDHKMIDDWLLEKLPGIEKTDAQNFHIVANR